MRTILRANGGWMHRADLLDRGWSKTGLARAAKAEGIPLLRRAWYVLPEAPQVLHRAARLGATLTCTSLLESAGVWRPPDDDRDHLHLPMNSPASDREARIHRTALNALVPQPPRTLSASVPLALLHASQCFPYDQAFAIWESAVNRRVIDIRALRSIPWPRAVARRLASDADTHSDSGIESLFLCRLRRRELPIRQQVPLAGHRVDFLIGERLVVQLDGYTFHSDARQRQRDIAHDRELVRLGYTVMRFDYGDIVHRWRETETQVLAAMAQGLHLSPRPRTRR